MTPEDFTTWRKSLGLTKLAAAAALGVHAETIANYEHGIRRDTGKAVVIPKSVQMACAWLALQRSGLVP